jgi:hypothetical protein
LYKKTQTFIFATILLPLCLSTSCSEAEDKYYIMDSLRVLAVKADKPWLHFGESATLEALLFVPDDAELSYQWRWCPTILNSVTGYACPLDQDALNALVEEVSEGELSAPSLDLGSNASATFDNIFPGELLTAICYGALEGSGNIGAAEIDCSSTYAISLVLEVQTADETIRAVKDLKLIIDPTLSPNQNPSISGLRIGEFDSALSDKEINEQKESILASAENVVDGESFNVSTDKGYALFAELPEGTAEIYTEPASEDTSAPANTEETLVISWFIELGEFDSTRTGYIPGEIDLDTAAENFWTPPVDLSDYDKEDAKIYIVVRDDRGGSSWLERSLDVSALGDAQ